MVEYTYINMIFAPLGGKSKDKDNNQALFKRQAGSDLVVVYAEEALREVIGQEISLETKPLFLKNRTLTVTCSSSATAQEVRLHQQEIIEKINQKLEKTEVDRIRYLL